MTTLAVRRADLCSMAATSTAAALLDFTSPTTPPALPMLLLLPMRCSTPAPAM
jgi:hypothetical protein